MAEIITTALQLYFPTPEYSGRACWQLVIGYIFLNFYLKSECHIILKHWQKMG